MRLANKPTQNHVTAEFLAAAQALPAIDLAMAADAAATPLLLDEPLQAQTDDVSTLAQDFPSAVADSSALVAYVAPPAYEDEPLLLAQASGGLGQTRSSSQGQVAGRAKPNGEEDDDGGAWWWLGGLGLLALGLRSGSDSDPAPATKTNYSLLDTVLQYNDPVYLDGDPSNPPTTTFPVNGYDASKSDYIASFGFSGFVKSGDASVSSFQVGIEYNVQTGVLTLRDGGPQTYQYTYANFLTDQSLSGDSNFKAFLDWAIDGYVADGGTFYSDFDETTGTFYALNGDVSFSFGTMDNQAFNTNVFNNDVTITYLGDGYAYFANLAPDAFVYGSNYFDSSTVLAFKDFDITQYVEYLADNTQGEDFNLAELNDPTKYYILLGDPDVGYDADPNLAGTQIFAYHDSQFVEINVTGTITNAYQLIQA